MKYLLMGVLFGCLGSVQAEDLKTVVKFDREPGRKVTIECNNGYHIKVSKNKTGSTKVLVRCK